ncbi:hypothetical protein D3C78_989860 [compost metagenome]
MGTYCSCVLRQRLGIITYSNCPYRSFTRSIVRTWICNSKLANSSVLVDASITGSRSCYIGLGHLGTTQHGHKAPHGNTTDMHGRTA